jgi:hypothetical protein
MKTKNVRHSAIVILRALIASLLCLTAVILALFAFLTLSHLGQRSAGGAVKLDKYPAEAPRTKSKPAKAIPYTGPPKDLRPVTAVRTGKLQYMTPIDPEKVVKSYHPEPYFTQVPKRSGGPDGPRQAIAGPISSAPSSTGLNFEGIGEGLAGFLVGGNPPDVNGRVGATQFVQWNNTSFAVFDKITGALEYGPAAGNTLFQSLGGDCASHNDGDPVVSYDILAGRWVISQFAVAATSGYSHQCVAVSTTSDATGEYYVYDFVTDQNNFVDYPHMGVWPDGYYVTTHVFVVGPSGLPVAAPSAFVAARVYVLERTKMIDGLPARMQNVDLGQDFG